MKIFRRCLPFIDLAGDEGRDLYCLGPDFRSHDDGRLGRLSNRGAEAVLDMW